jgi:UDP-N-acetylmuramate dehydrogenase
MSNSMLGDMADRIKAVAPASQVECDEPMSDHTTFRVGGPADLFVRPVSRGDFAAILKLCVESRVPFLVIGQGSNLIVKDGGYRGIVIQLGERMSRIAIAGDKLRAEAGAKLSDVARAAGRAGLSGLEFAVGIPGSVGGAVFMNAGAYDGEIGSCLSWCAVVDAAGEERVIQRTEMRFGYRHSILQEEQLFALEAEFTLTPGDLGGIETSMKDYTLRRESKQPLDLPSAGSVFRRPQGFFVGKLVDDAGLRGYQIGGAKVSEKHTVFIVNAGGATTNDVLTLIAHVQNEVFQRFGVQLHTEVRVVGEDLTV